MSAKTRLFLTIEKLKNAMDDAQMRFPFWEQFFPLLGDATTIDVDLSVLSELINEAAIAAENLIITQGGAVYSQYLYGNAGTDSTRNQLRAPLRRGLLPSPVTVTLDVKKYASFAEKIMNYFVSSSVTSTSFKIKDLIMLYLFLSHTPKYKNLFSFIESVLFRKDKECVPVLEGEATSVILDNLRDLTGITNIRLDYESLMAVNVSLQRTTSAELSKYPQVKVRDYITNMNVYEKVTDPCKAFVDKFQLLLSQKVQHIVDAKDNYFSFGNNPLIIENIAINIEKSSDMNRMVFNAINNIFINTVEQCASENIKFDVADYNRRFRIMDRARESGKNNFVEKVAIGDVVTRKRSKTTTSTTSEIKRYKSKKFADDE
ncbi:hypothetical protein AsGV088 [Agrotis segetum granulovirus]|uniref:P40 n=1 Tax=Agrotis segetum granulosis virus TaxID=10464 RepID=A0A023MHF3_GVAS|nr:hypothetical protein AsGV088 [Agrotis segetum granulovirus]AHN92126.1 hypothetical protein AsGV087 [Agrotis segetum granulovirus]AKN63362.1 hypothetical protein AsGV088 [Agrotis segetum granulovirus]